MRQVSPATNLLLACLSAVGLLAVFDLPWFAPPVKADDSVGAVEQTAAQFAAMFQHADRAMTGHDAFADAQTLLTVMPAAIIGLCLLMAVPVLRDLVREPLRAVAFGTPLVVAYLVFARPGDATGTLHWGALAGMAVSLFLTSAAWHGSALRGPRPAPRSLAT
jgi:O-antigen/teichoic acid export membrane protein